MKAYLRAALALILTLAFCNLLPAQNPPAKTHAKYRTDRILVRFRPNTKASVMAQAHARVGGQKLRSFRIVPGLQLVKIAPRSTVAESVRAYQQDPSVLYAEPDYIVHTTVTPNDPRFTDGTQWDLNNFGQSGGTPGADIGTVAAWNITTGSSNVVIFDIDTGYDQNHPDLQPNLFFSPSFTVAAWNITCPTNVHGFDAVNLNCNPFDDNGHGTHTAGTIGASGNNGIGVAGVNWTVRLGACKFLDFSGSGATSDAITCLDIVKDLKDNHGVNIVATNNSWGGPFYSQSLFNAIQSQMASGILFIAAAGNAGFDNDVNDSYPANYDLPNLISVAATDRNDALAGFSEFGKRSVDLGAPGVSIISTVPNNGYAIASGTSMATPHVTGVAALLKAQDGSRDWRAIKNLILAGGDTKPSLMKTVTGKRLNANGSMTCSNSTILSRIEPRGDTAVMASGDTMRVLHINCAVPAGDVQVSINPGGISATLKDDGIAPDQVAGDGIYSGVISIPAPGSYVASINGGETFNLEVVGPYFYQPTTYSYRTITGTSLNFTDDEVAKITPGFSIPFGGASFNSLWVSNNGMISFDSAFTSPINGPFPVHGPTTLVAPLWNDLIAPSSAENVFWSVLGSPGTRELVIEWRDLPYFCDSLTCPSGGTVRFQVVFFEDKSDVLFNYADTFDVPTPPFSSNYNYGASSTIGVQSSFSSANQFTNTLLEDGVALLWTTTGPNVKNPVPTLASISPTPVQANSFFTLTINGTGFTPQSFVRLDQFAFQHNLNATVDLPTTFVSSTQLTAQVSGSDIPFADGSYTVRVFTFDGGTTSGAALTVVAPVISSISPSVTPLGGPDFTLTVTGSNFVSGDTVNWNGSPRTTAFVDANHLTATITAADIANTAVVAITVTSPYAVTSNSVPFSVTTPPLGFIPVTPCRIADTRNANGPFGGPFLSGNATARSFTIPNSACSIPNTAQAYSLNVTVVPHGALGFLTMFPCGQTQPLVSTLNSDGRTKAVGAILPAGTNGAVCAFATNDTDLVLDINGYFVGASDPSALAFYPVTPCRMVDTRGATGLLGGPALVGGQTRDFPLGAACGLPATVQAYSLNFTVVPKGALGFLTTWPTGQSQPLVSTLNAPTGTVVANAAIVPAGTFGDVNVFVTNNADLVIDVDGYFAPPGTGGLALYNVPPCRALDTRNPSGSFPFGGQLDVSIAGSACPTPPFAKAFVLNSTVVPPGPLGFLTLWPQGATQPVVSTLNANDGAITSNMAIVPTTNGSVSAYASNQTHLVLDISAYFGSASPTAAPPFRPATNRSLDLGSSTTGLFAQVFGKPSHVGAVPGATGRLAYEYASDPIFHAPATVIFDPQSQWITAIYLHPPAMTESQVTTLLGGDWQRHQEAAGACRTGIAALLHPPADQPFTYLYDASRGRAVLLDGNNAREILLLGREPSAQELSCARD